jgi:hypothetical protein
LRSSTHSGIQKRSCLSRVAKGRALTWGPPDARGEGASFKAIAAAIADERR